MFDNVQNEFKKEVRKVVESKLIKKLNNKGISRSDISDYKFQEFLAMEIEILKNDGKKVGAGLGVGILLTLLTGGLF